ncbi:hypothetical protein [Shewanella atlantica]|uniref:HNH endonuclease n=1 Tax=Shewanella atlantica TaxID=271099 RepID=A0A3S0IE18_9GAMM|nr:hypothetical protein [Shewanella atlantica]RTR31659.1 hypothetical protein EKG39_13165 [Shewanella atlantica]
MKCKLCGKERPLRQSHIIPEFAFSPLYDEKHRFNEISLDVKRRNRFKQKGVRERLLCGQCEQFFSKYEQYASTVISRYRKSLEFRQVGDLFHLKGFDYNKLKIFALSILWRASVTKLEFFAEINLEHHESIIHQMLLTESPGDESDYPLMLFPMYHHGKIQEDLITTPYVSEIEGHKVYCFLFLGLTWAFIVSNKEKSNRLIECSLSRTGEIIMLPRALEHSPRIVDMAKDMARSGKL